MSTSDNTSGEISRRALLKSAAASALVFALPAALGGCGGPRTEERVAPESSEDLIRLRNWSGQLRADGLTARTESIGRASTKVGELAIGTPYKAFTLEEYIKAGGDPTAKEPLTLSLTEFDCVSLVEACLGVARAADASPTPSWGDFGGEVERMRYRGGQRGSYSTRLHYFSEWITDGARRGLVRDLGQELGGVQDNRPLRFMTEHRASYPALANDNVFREIGEMERSLDSSPRWIIPTARISEMSDRIQTGDVLAFATAIPGLDVTHAAFAYRDVKGVLRVLHAPLSGGVVEITRLLLPEYVAAIKRSTGILIARPLRA